MVVIELSSAVRHDMMCFCVAALSIKSRDFQIAPPQGPSERLIQFSASKRSYLRTDFSRKGFAPDYFYLTMMTLLLQPCAK